ncbi:MAG TPA: hypothetical protein VNI01_16120, partial [Elusimicrobiota bacterium]|nr:hypothetical protein [Elusimicrobiota bacterium]
MKLIRATLAATLSAALAVQPALAGNTRLIRSGGAGSSAGLAGVELSVAAPSATAPLATALSGEGLAQPAVSPEMAAPRTEAFPVSEAVAPPATLGEVKASNVERREAAPDGSGSGSGFKGKQERPLVPGGKEVGETLEPTRSAATAEGAGAAMGGAFQRLILGGPGRGAVNGAEIPAAVGAPGAPARARLLAAPQAALGTPGVYSEDFHERYTNPRVRADMEAGRFVRLRVEGRRPVLLEAGPGVPEEEARAAAARLAELPELPLGFHGAEILLLKPEPGSDAARHPRHLVVSAGEQQVAHAGTHRDEAGAARGLYAYLPIGLALDAAVDANALRDLVAEELGHAHDRARALYAGRAPPRETFGTGQASLLARLHASLSLDFAAGRPADAEAAPAPRRAWPIRALAALGRWWSKRRASVDEVVPWSFPLVDNGYYYHGTTLEDLTAIVRSGGLMTPEVSQFSMRARDSIEYGSTRRRRQVASGQPTPLALLQFRYDDVSGYMSGKSFQAGVDAALAMGMFPIHAAYVAAEKPVPLSRMTEASKDSLLSYLALRRSLEPENTRWAALLPEFEKALGKRYEPARPAAAEAGAPAAERDPLLLGSPGAASSGSHRRALAAGLAAQGGVRYTISGGRLAPAGAGASSPRAAAIAGLPAELEGAELVLVPPAAPHPLLLAADAEHYTAAYARVRRDAAGRPLGIALYLPEALFSDPRLSDEDVRDLVAGELERARARAQASPLR